MGFYNGSSGMKHESGTIINNGTFALNGYTRGLINKSDLTNNGYLFLNNKVENDPSGSIINDAFCISYFNGTHDLSTSSTFINNAIVEDHYNSFIGTNLDNQQVIVRRIIGPMQNGVVFTDPIEVVDHSNITINEWNDDYTGVQNIAGSYDIATNEFIPNSYAINLDELFLSIEINAMGISRNVRLPMDNPIVAVKRPFSGNIKAFTRDRTETSQESQEINVYPNPNLGQFNLRSERFMDAPTDIHIYDLTGQLVLAKKIKEGSDSVSLELPSSAVAGLYNIHALQNGELISCESMLLQK